MEEIRGFNEEYRFLSNFWVGKPIVVAGKEWMSAEHLYQALKTAVPEEIEAIRLASTPGRAKWGGTGVTLRPHWGPATRKAAMRFTLAQKFLQDYELLSALMDTKGKILVEGNTWHDNFFGDCSCEACEDIWGENILGMLLMGIRSDALEWTDTSWMNQ